MAFEQSGSQLRVPKAAELQLRKVSLRDIHEARAMIEPMAARQVAGSPELQVMRRYARPMPTAEAEEQAALNLRSVAANDQLLKLLEARDADGAEAYWTRHLSAVGATLLGTDADTVVDLPD